MARTKLGANAIFTGPQKGLSIIGERCYAYSGSVNVPQAETTVLLFNTEANVIKAGIQIISGVDVSDNYELNVYLNGSTIWQQRLTNTVQEFFYGNYPINLIIPPLSEVKVTLQNITSDTDRLWSVLFTGRVYDV